MPMEAESKLFCIFSNGEFGSARALNNVVLIFTSRFIRMIFLSVRYKQTGIFASNNIEEMYCCPTRGGTKNILPLK
jgi:hypothetical protein